MIKIDRLSVVLRFILLFVVCSSVAEAVGDKKDNSLLLPMPNGITMEFMPVCVNQNSGLYDWKKIKLGDPSGGFKEYPTSMALGGSFPIEKNGKKMWCYYMGKYEITEKQYASLMRAEKPFPKKKRVYPVTNISWFDAMEFSNRYNQWLYANAKEEIPKFDNSYGFVRLPTEAEWEFAARGGSAVSEDVFDQKTPYSSNTIQKYEWYGGPTSSYYKLQPIGVLKPNPLGLHDMLGNADEITMSLFRVEYYQGRTGGFVVKGNNYTTAKNKLRSSFRTEQPFYRFDSKGVFKPHTKKTLGFRLIISALVFPSRKVQKEMSNEWEGYRTMLGANTPAALSTSTISTQVAAGGEDAFSYLDRLKKRLNQRGFEDSEIKNTLGYLDSSIRNMATIRLKFEKDNAYLNIKNAGEQARAVIRETKLLVTRSDLLISIAKSQNDMPKVERYEKRKEERRSNIKQTFTNYTDSIRKISDFSPEAVRQGFAEYLDFLLLANDAEQVRLINKMQKHVDEYQKNKRVNPKEWEDDILL